jgi:hypothetical protein
MNKLLSLVAAVVMLLGVQAASAQTKNSASTRFRLVQAQCTTGPCHPSLTFSRGSGKINNVKQPKPVGNRFFGKIKITGVTSGSLSQLDAEVEGRRIYGVDPDGDCALASTESTGVFGTSTMICRSNVFTNESRCSGKLFFDLLTPPECSDVPVHTENIRVNVYEEGFAGVLTGLIATNGAFSLGKSPDCNSGGTGCP